jgi:membrane-bound lytic murein transglycosylase D
MRFFAAALIFFGVAASYAQTPQVPHKMRFADMTLTIRDDARREIQKNVDALTKSPKYFGIKVERARTYFPFIEKVFAEERLPDDFKYLVLQESALISDAVSVSNAVGFWQFKDYTAMEMGLRVDKVIDERMNIISASRGAARYLKQSNFMFNNWLFALQAYQMGAGGVKRVVGDEYNGAKHMDITSDTYWYVKKFLAHKVAFEDAVKGEPQVKVDAFEVKEKKDLKDLVKELGVEETVLIANNKWIRSGSIPGDRTYTLLLPKGNYQADFNTLAVYAPVASTTRTTSAAKTVTAEKKSDKEINGVPTIQALDNESHSAIASRAGVGLSVFLRYNDMSIADPIKGGEYYFKAKKKSKSKTLTHTMMEGEDLWTVSQRYGVTLKRVKKMNRLTSDQEMKSGEVVWVGAKKPVYQPDAGTTALAVAAPEPQQDSGEFFDWEVKPDETDTSVKNPLKDTAIKIPEQPATTTTVKKEIEEVKSANTIPSGTHVVVPGETLYSISKLYQVEVTELLTWNNLDITQPLKPGQQLVTFDTSVKETQTEALTTAAQRDEWVTHEVKTSDTLYSVARQYNVTIKEIMDWNGKSDFTLAQGEKLKILSK